MNNALKTAVVTLTDVCLTSVLMYADDVVMPIDQIGALTQENGYFLLTEADGALLVEDGGYSTIPSSLMSNPNNTMILYPMGFL